MPSQNEIHALINLLDDPDDSVYTQVKDRLFSLGEDVIPSLENFWEYNSFGVVFQNRIEELIHEIQFDALKIRLSEWKADGGKDLIEGACLIARYQYPDLDEKKIFQKIDQIERDIWLEINNNLTAFEKVKIFNHILFEVHEFTGNKKNYHAPQNSYINNVLDTKRGNPLTLSVIYIALAKRLDVPIFGVNLPSHFVVCYLDENNLGPLIFGSEKEAHNSRVLFFINPFSKGTFFNHQEVEHFLKELNIEPREEFFNPCDNLAIIERMVTNLIYSYNKLGYTDKVEELEELKRSIER